MAQLTILDYSTNSVFVYTTPFFKSNEAAENWIMNNTPHKLSQISFLISKEPVEINYPTTEKYHIKYWHQKSQSFKEKTFEGYHVFEKAETWAKKNLTNYNPDIIRKIY